MKRRNIFWGILLLVGAVVLLADKLGFIEGAGIWTIFLTAFLITVLVKSVMKRKFGRLLFAAAFLVILNDDLLHLEAITPWPVLWAALLGTIGLKLLFPTNGGTGAGHFLRIENGVAGEWAWNGREASYSNIFGESVKYMTEVFRQVRIKNTFGSTEVFFMDAIPQDGLADVCVENIFGSVELYVPSSWKVVINTENVFSNVEENGRKCQEEGNELRVSGSVVFGSLEVTYI